MQKSVKFLVLLCCVIAHFDQNGIRAAETDYCSLCDNHIACDNDGKFSPMCSKDAANVKMTQSLQKLILDLHNNMRNKVAKGELSGYEPATRMGYLQWDPELAHLAKLNTRRCKFSHDDCHNTDRFKYAGQNIFNIKITNAYADPIVVAKNATNVWFDEYKSANMDIINSLQTPPPDSTGKSPMVFHFTQIVHDISDRIGCAISRYMENDWYVSYIVCNYAVTNIQDRSIYTAGETASECTTGTHDEYDGLCGVNEDFGSL